MSGLSNMTAKRPSKAVVQPVEESLARLHVDVPAELLKSVKLRAVQTDQSLRELVITALTELLAR